MATYYATSILNRLTNHRSRSAIQTTHKNDDAKQREAEAIGGEEKEKKSWP